MFRNCLNCKKEFTLHSGKRGRNGRFCSLPCYWQNSKGKHFSPATEIKKGQRIGEITEFKNGHALTRGEKHGMWKGEAVGYNALHTRIRRTLGNPTNCKECKTTTSKRFEWANVSGKYKTELSDWMQLCKACHVQFDRNRCNY